MVGKDKTRVNVTLKKDTYAGILEVAEASGMTFSQVMQILAEGLLESLNEEEPAPSPAPKRRRRK